VTDFGFIEAKLKLLGVQPLIEDYDLGRNADVLLSQEQTQTLNLIQGGIRKSAHVLEKDKTELAGQLLGRLLDFEMTDIQGLLEQAKQSKNSLWLRLLRTNLERPGEGCLRTLTGHTHSVFAVAIAPDGLTAISASADNTLKIWDLLSGKEIASSSGDGGFYGCAILPDGMNIVAGDALGRVHFLRLEGMGDLGDV
jgi:WD40 repeat protein